MTYYLSPMTPDRRRRMMGDGRWAIGDGLEVMGDGSAIRDFIYCDDVARGMLMAVEKQITDR